MKKYAVAVLSFFENENKVFIVEADNESEAMGKALVLFNENNDEDYTEWVNELSQKTVEKIQEECFDGEIAISKPVEIM